MSYTINFVGLICFIRNTQGFLAALPEGKSAKSPGGTALAPHYPYLIARTNDISLTSVTPPWPNLFVRNGMTFYDISNCTLNFAIANTPGTIDAQQFTDETYNWADLDKKFKINDKDKPKNATAKAALRQGIFHACRMPKHNALIGQVDLASAGAQIKVTTQDNRYIVFKNDSDIVVANVSKTFAEQDIPDNDVDDFLYLLRDR